MPRNSWHRWVASGPVERPLKQQQPSNGDSVVRLGMYVDITCPNCGDKFDALQASVKTNKAYICNAHLAEKRCHIPEAEREEFTKEQTLSLLPPSKRNRLSVVTHKSCNENIQLLKTQMALSNQKTETLEQEMKMVKGKLSGYDLMISDINQTLPVLAPVDVSNIVPKLQLQFNTLPGGSNLIVGMPSTSNAMVVNDQAASSTYDLEARNRYLTNQLAEAERKNVTFRKDLKRVALGEETVMLRKLYKRGCRAREEMQIGFNDIDAILREYELPQECTTRLAARMRDVAGQIHHIDANIKRISRGELSSDSE